MSYFQVSYFVVRYFRVSYIEVSQSECLSSQLYRGESIDIYLLLFLQDAGSGVRLR